MVLDQVHPRGVIFTAISQCEWLPIVLQPQDCCVTIRTPTKELPHWLRQQSMRMSVLSVLERHWRAWPIFCSQSGGTALHKHRVYSNIQWRWPKFMWGWARVGVKKMYICMYICDIQTQVTIGGFRAGHFFILWPGVTLASDPLFICGLERWC